MDAADIDAVGTTALAAVSAYGAISISTSTGAITANGAIASTAAGVTIAGRIDRAESDFDQANTDLERQAIARRVSSLKHRCAFRDLSNARGSK